MHRLSSFFAPLKPSRRFLHLLWFPLFFAVAFGSMFVVNVGHASPHGVKVGVLGDADVVAGVEQEVTVAQPGIDFQAVVDEDAAREAIGANALAAVLDMQDPAEPRLFVALAASGSRALYLENMVERVLQVSVQEVDVVPPSSGDFTGVGLFFFSLPLQVLGLITAAILGIAQVGSWRQKFVWIGVYGCFAAGFMYVLCSALNVIPHKPVLALLALLLNQTIAWIAVGAAAFLRHFFLPVVMPFVVIFEIPISGGPMSADMMPLFSQVLHAVLPFSRYLDAARGIAYFHGAGATGAILVLVCWTAVGLGLMLAGMWWSRRLDRRSATLLSD